jgi:Protein of unknown function (DUF2637)
MSNYPPGRGPRPADPYPGLRLTALTAVILGVVLLATAAFVLSYAGIHQIALRAAVGHGLARLYPVIFDAMVVISGAAALALRGAGWWARAYAWSSLLLMLAVVATADALHATSVSLPAQPTRAVVAVTPWALLLIAFGLWLEMLRHFRSVRATGAPQARMAGPVAAAPAAANGDSATAHGVAVTWASAGDVGVGRPLPQPRMGLDLILGPNEENLPAMTLPAPDTDAAAAAYPGQTGQRETGRYPDPVSYGEDTGYVHPESYRDPGGYADYSGHGDYSDWAAQPPPPHPADGAATPQTEDTRTPQAGDTASHQAEDQAGDTASHQAEDHAGDTAPRPAGFVTEPGPAGDQDAPGPGGDGAQAPAPSAMLDRLRSTPTPPED